MKLTSSVAGKIGLGLILTSVTILSAGSMPQTAPAAAQGMGQPTAAQKAAVAARKYLRRIHDEYPQFSSVAVDPERNEVVVTDENLFQTMVYDRTTNTPAKAKMSEPKRAIRGP